MKDNKKSIVICILTVLVVCVILVFLPLIINHIYYLEAPSKFFITDLNVADFVVYYASALSFLGSLILGMLTLYQNKRAQEKTDEISKDAPTEQIIIPVEDEPNEYTLHRRTPFNHATILCRKEMYDVLGGYTDSESTVRCEDKDLWYRFFALGLKGKNLCEPLYRLHENSELIYRNTARSRWNDFVTDLGGYRLLRYPWYWYWKPFVNLVKVLVPKKMVVWYYKRFRH